LSQVDEGLWLGGQVEERSDELVAEGGGLEDEEERVTDENARGCAGVVADRGPF